MGLKHTDDVIKGVAAVEVATEKQSASPSGLEPKKRYRYTVII